MLRRTILTFIVAYVASGNHGGCAHDKPNPTGTWKWTNSFGKGDDRKSYDVILKLKLEGDRLTGAVVIRKGNEFPITDGQFKDGEVSFKYVRGEDESKFTRKYRGKLRGDTISGTIQSEFGGRASSREWEAKRVKE